MKALIYDGQNLKLSEVDRPDIKEDHALIRVLLAGICNTDLEILKGYMNFTGILGHEFVGVVEQGPEDLIGKRVVGEINIPCNECDLCLNGLHRHCRNIRVLGIRNYDGVFAEYTLLPVKNLHIVPEKIENERAVFIEPLAAAFRILQQIELSGSQKVAVLGDGKLGLLVSKALSFSKIPHIVFGKHEEKLSLANKWTSTEFSHNFKQYDRYFDTVIDATGRKSGIEQALQIVKPEGTIVLKTTIAGKIDLDLSVVAVNEIKVIGSRCGPFPVAISALANSLEVRDLIESTFDLSEYQKAFERASKSSLKLLLKIDGQ
ncbi:MAG TPA: alcohol dehydrogenase catalytic domain-containing protein [Pseudothermotoga sp.]|nr:alcohol dehydrogenase catalytic domain-containing protein [Pseudothermotoga sp.]HPP69644.1 alcohol dehydrogenase catalytic domain-containing protein [Pseudothermotoga sp.]